MLGDTSHSPSRARRTFTGFPRGVVDAAVHDAATDDADRPSDLRPRVVSREPDGNA
jgi:hypothetical protein